jgi:hypothetical protein
VIAHPVLGSAYVLGMNGLARLLYNPSFVRAAIRGFKTPAGTPAAAAAAGAMVSAARAAGVPVTTTKAPAAIAPEASGVQGSEGVPIHEPIQTNAGGATSGGESLPRTGGSGQAQTLPGLGVGNAETTIKVAGKPGAGYRATYKVKELEDLQASHSGITFQENPNYGPGVQQRDYTNAANQGKIVNWSSASEFDPAYHISDNPDATNGPPAIDSSGNVLGGNGRVNIMQRVYAMNPKGAAAYRGLLESKASQFGIDPASLKGMKKPVLVREIHDAELGGGRPVQSAIADFNVKPTAELTPAERAISDSRRVSQSTLEHVAGRLEAHGSDATVAQILEGRPGVAVLDRLIADGVVSPQERAAFAEADELTPAGKDRISALMVGRYFEDPKQLDTIPRSIRNKIERIAAPLAQVETSPEWSLTPAVKDALSMLDQADKLHIRNIDDFIRQDGLFGEQKHAPEAVALARAIHGMKPLDLLAAVRQYASEAGHAGRGSDMFGNDPTPAGSFEAAFKLAAKKQ